MVTIYGSDGTVKIEAPCDDNSTQAHELMGDNVLTLSFTLYEHVALEVNDYAEFRGQRYWLMERYRPEQKSTVEWQYDVRLYGVESLVKRFLVLNDTDGDDEPVFTLTAPPREHVALIVRSINRGMGREDWKVGTVEGEDNVVIDYEGKYCDEALRELAEKAGGRAEWWVEGQTVNVCRCETGEEVTLGYGKGLTDLSCDMADNADFYTRLYPIGSSRNIDPERYGHSRLQLPGGVKHVDVNVEKYGVWHRYEEAAFADIYPRRTGTVSSVRSEEEKGEDGTPFKIFYFKDDSLGFDPNSYEIAGRVKRISFQEGSELAGLGDEEDGTYYFEANYDSQTREFELITIWPYDDGTQLPSDTLCPKAGDRYILWNIRMPDEYYTLAEQEFREAVDRYNEENAVDAGRYKAPTDHVYIEQNGIDLSVGRRVRLESTQFFPETGYRLSRVTKITRRVNLPSQMDLEISDATSTGAMETINGSIADVKKYVKTATAGSFPDLIRSWDNTYPTDNNVFSARRSLKESLSRLKDDTAAGHISFQKGIDVVGTAKAEVVEASGRVTAPLVNADVVEAVQQVKSPLIEAKTDASDGLVDADIIKGKRVEAPLVEAKTEAGTGLVDADRVKAVSVEATRVEAQTVEAADRVATKDLTATGRVGSKEFAEGIVGGRGWRVGADGAAELDQLTIRRFLEVPELRYNRVTVTVGDKWRAPGGGIIESVDTQAKTCRLKLEEGEIGAVRKGDICMGIYHSPVASENAAADSDDSRMNRQYAGFATVYFTITGVSGERSEEFTYQLRPASERWPREVEPYAFMHFACYGSFTDPERQTSVYETRTYTRMLVGQNTWECGPQNIGLQIGDLSGLSVHDLDMEGYSAYLSNVYFTGTIKQVRPDGTPVQAANDRGQWDAAKAPYAYYDRVSHGGRIWLCIAEDGTAEEPTPGCSDWLLQVDRGDAGEGALWVSVMSSRGNFFQGGVGETVLTATVRRGDADITASLPPSSFSWRRTSPDAEADALWNRVHEAVGPSVAIDDDDVTRSATFECVVTVD